MHSLLEQSLLHSLNVNAQYISLISRPCFTAYKECQTSLERHESILSIFLKNWWVKRIYLSRLGDTLLVLLLYHKKHWIEIRIYRLYSWILGAIYRLLNAWDPSVNHKRHWKLLLRGFFCGEWKMKQAPPRLLCSHKKITLRRNRSTYNSKNIFFF